MPLSTQYTAVVGSQPPSNTSLITGQPSSGPSQNHLQVQLHRLPHTLPLVRVAGGMSPIVGPADMVWRIYSFRWCKDIRRSFYDHVFPLLSWDKPEGYGHVRRKAAMCGGP